MCCIRPRAARRCARQRLSRDRQSVSEPTTTGPRPFRGRSTQTPLPQDARCRGCDETGEPVSRLSPYLYAVDLLNRPRHLLHRVREVVEAAFLVIENGDLDLEDAGR